jgi:aspartyl-tRNA(Asn)/glutamyl-tRNA(Gln) amidotransferase subunit A
MPTDPSDLPWPGARAAARLVARRRLSPVELVEACLARTAALNPRYNAFLTVTADTARDAARRAEARLARRSAAVLPLTGVPLSVKDLLLTREAPTTAGSRVFGAGLPAGRDAPAVARLRRAGAVLLGKTNLHEVAFGVTTENEHFGRAVNPWSVDRVAGGSSGGSAVAVALGLGAASLGTDTRGSIRIPAACCGITGLKPTFGLVPTDDVVPLAPTLDHVGPMTRSVEDAALLLGVLTGSRAALTRYLAAVDRKPGRLRLGVSEYYLRDAAPEIVRALEEAVRVFRRLGWEILEAELPVLDQALEASRVIVLAEALAFHERFLRERPEGYGPLVRSRLEGGRSLSAVDLVRAEEERVLLTEGMAELFARVDLLLGAVLPVMPAPAGTTRVTLAGQELTISEAYCRYNAPQNVCGVPALAIPAGMSGGLPIGVQLVAGWRREETLLAAGAAFQRATDWHLRRPRT